MTLPGRFSKVIICAALLTEDFSVYFWCSIRIWELSIQQNMIAYVMCHICYSIESSHVFYHKEDDKTESFKFEKRFYACFCILKLFS